MFRIRLNSQSTGQFPKGRELGTRQGGRERREGGGGKRSKGSLKMMTCVYVCVYPTNELNTKYESHYYPSVIKRRNKNVIIRLLPNLKVSRNLDKCFTKRIYRG